MTQYNSTIVNLSNSQFNNLKPAIKNATEKPLTVSSNIIGDSNDGTSFPHKLLLTDRQVPQLRKVFKNSCAAKLYKIVQSDRFLGRVLEPIMKLRLLLIKNVFKQLPKSVLITFQLTPSAASARDAGIHKKKPVWKVLRNYSRYMKFLFFRLSTANCSIDNFKRSNVRHHENS